MMPLGAPFNGLCIPRSYFAACQRQSPRYPEAEVTALAAIPSSPSAASQRSSSGTRGISIAVGLSSGMVYVLTGDLTGGGLALFTLSVVFVRELCMSCGILKFMSKRAYLHHS